MNWENIIVTLYPRSARAAREERRRKAQEERDAQILAEQEADTGESDTEVKEVAE